MEKHFMLGHLQSQGHGLQPGLYVVVEGFGVGIRCVLLRSNY